MRVVELLNLLSMTTEHFAEYGDGLSEASWPVSRDTVGFMMGMVEAEDRATFAGMSRMAISAEESALLAVRTATRLTEGCYVSDLLAEDIMAALSHVLRNGGLDQIRRILEDADLCRRQIPHEPPAWEVKPVAWETCGGKRPTKPARKRFVMNGMAAYVITRYPFNNVDSALKLYPTIEEARNALEHAGDLARDTCKIEEVVVVKKSDLEQMVNEGGVTINVEERFVMPSPNLTWGAATTYTTYRRI